MTAAYVEKSKAQWSTKKMQNLLESSMQAANSSFVESNGTSQAMLARRWALLDSTDLLSYEDVGMNDESSSVHIPGEENNGLGVGGGSARRDTGQEELDVNDPAVLLMLQLLMPWNTLTHAGDAPQDQDEQ